MPYPPMSIRTTGERSRQTRFAASVLAQGGAAFLAVTGCSSERAESELTASTAQALSSCINLPATGDATLQNPPMNRNFGAAPILRAGDRNEALLRFDLSAIPTGAAIDRATLTLSVTGGDEDEDDDDDACELDREPHHRCPTVNVHRANVAWSEASVTFASFAQHFDSAVAGSLFLTSNHMAKSVGMTALVTTWVTGARPNYGVLLETRSRRGTVFVSREGGRPEQRPVLQVCFTLPDNHCASAPCQHGGTCTNRATGYTCACAPGYTGTDCETLVNNCAASPCQNGGACTNGVNSYTCVCAPGFTGANCEINIDECASAPCQNSGVCQDGIASYACHCAPGYVGTSCETLVDNCAASPCLNGGACTNGVNSYMCVCAPGFSGANCQTNIDDCVGNACQNGATCIDGVNVYTCSCPPDWGGARCDLNLNSCSQSPCLNGATCVNGLGNYTCSCAPGYSGINCQIDVNECAVNPCMNGGICVDGVNAYSCQCANGYSGAACEIPPAIVTRTPWQMHDGLGAVDTLSNLLVLPCRPPVDDHAPACVYDVATTPPSLDAAWRAAPSASTIEYFLTPSRVCSAPFGRTCNFYGDFTYFQTFINVPSDFAATQFNISSTRVDEGMRITIYNPAHPVGVVAAYVSRSPTGMPSVSGEMSQWLQPGATNRLVVEQIDDCCSASELLGVVMTLNGQVL